MRLVVVTPPATEPLTMAEVKSFARIDGTNAEPAPGAIVGALAAVGAGLVDNGAHRYLATFVTATGETDAGVQSAAIAVVDKTVNGKVQLTGIPLGGAAVTARKIYRTIAGGAAFLLLTTIADNVTTVYLDNTADAGLGAGAPAVNTTDDPLLSLLLSSARLNAEMELRRFLVTQTLELYLDRFPCPTMPRPYGYPYLYGLPVPVPDIRNYESILLPPLQSVTSITYTDTNGNAQVLDPAQYLVDAVSKPARITPAYNTSWPATRSQANAVIVRFVAGYGAAAAVPACVKQWMLLQIKTAWDNRDGLIVGERGQVIMPTSYVDGLLDRERVLTF